MTPERFAEITSRYADLRIAVLGDFCLDRYLEIDPAKQEISIETGLPVHNITNVRAQPGGAGTILNNLSALGIGHLWPIGFAGEDGEGFELWRALEKVPGVRLNYFVKTAQRRTFSYCKPLIMAPNQPPVELNRLDLKNWTPTPALLQGLLKGRLMELAQDVDAIIVLDQVDVPQTGVITETILGTLQSIITQFPHLLIMADSRRGLRGFPNVTFKMNARELADLTGCTGELSVEAINEAARAVAVSQRRNVFVTMAAAGMLGARPNGLVEHVPALPLRGSIDVVGAGDAVTANLTAAQLGGATLREALELASAAASVVIHKLGTTGTARLAEIGELIQPPTSKKD